MVGFLQPKTFSLSPAPNSLQRSRDKKDTHLPDKIVRPSPNNHLRAVQSPFASRIVPQMDQATSPYQEVLRHIGECREGANLDCGVGICAHRHHQKTPRLAALALHFATGIFCHLFEKIALNKDFLGAILLFEDDMISNQLNLFDNSTGQ